MIWIDFSGNTGISLKSGRIQGLDYCNRFDISGSDCCQGKCRDYIAVSEKTEIRLLQYTGVLVF